MSEFWQSSCLPRDVNIKNETMKKAFYLGVAFTLAMVLSGFVGLDDGNCYDKYAKKFEERGANEVEDGWHDDVVVTFRKGSNADCLIGKVLVEEGKITQIQIANADGTYEWYKKKFKTAIAFTITNGISATQITVDDELINVIFVKHIRPPKKKFMVAPDPDDL